jgi:hypothetical protein
MLVLVASLFMTNIVLAGEELTTYSDPDLGTTNPDHLVSRTAFSSLRQNVNNIIKSELNRSTRVKVKNQFKTMCFVDQDSSELCSDFNFYDIFPLKAKVIPQYSKI